MRPTGIIAFAAQTFTAATFVTATGAAAATFGELNGNGPAGMQGMAPSYPAGPYAGAPVYCAPNCIVPGMTPGGTASGMPYGGMVPMANVPLRSGPEGVPPGDPGASPEGPFVPSLAANPRGYLPFRSYADGPNAPMMLWSFGQYNAGTDPYNAFGLSTPYMRVPWSTPMAGWTNSQTWNWWRERSGALPRNW